MKTEDLFGVESDCPAKGDTVDCEDVIAADSELVKREKDDAPLTVSSSSDHHAVKSESTTTTTITVSLTKAAACTLDDDMQDMYSGRNYGLPSSRPTMISAKYRQKEERRKVLKLSMNKLKRIEDPESSLRRSVLINNTVKRLQREAKEEKTQKSQITASLASQNKCFGITSDFIVKQEENLKNDFANALTSRNSSSTVADQLLDITNLPDGSAKTTCSKYGHDCLDCDEAISDLTFPTSGGGGGGGGGGGQHHHHHHQHHDHRIIGVVCGSSALTVTAAPARGRKRSIDETLEEECDVLSQFYLPPTPRMMPSLDEDEDEDVNVVDVDTPPPEPLHKKRRGGGCEQDSIMCCLTAADRLRDNLPTSHFDEWSMDESILLQTNTNTNNTQTSQSTPSSSPFSCGHSSMLNEIVVYHNLIASLES